MNVRETGGKVLVFGGNGFIGAETVQHLLKAGCKVTVLNRGRSWDWDTGHTVKPFVTWIKHDRKKSLFECAELNQHMDDIKIDVVVDFSGYGKFAVKESAAFFKRKINLYIFISSDSVYEVCQDKSHAGATKETDAMRPLSKDVQYKLKQQDSYGHKKLSCEEILLDQRKNGGFPFLILRLADVIGPRDSTDRWWQYQMWIKLAAKTGIPVLIPKCLEQRQLSMVYVHDIAVLITQLARHYKQGEQSMLKEDGIVDKAYNLAFSSSFTLLDLLQYIQKELDGKAVTFQWCTSQNVPHIYPSVERGPVNISKAGEMLLWNPTPWKVAVKETVTFYEQVLDNPCFVKERQEIFDSLMEDLVDLFPVNELALKTLLHL